LGASTVATNFTNNYLDNYRSAPEMGISGFNQSLGRSKGVFENYKNWSESLVASTPNWYPGFFPWDARGYEIYQHWMNGSGASLSRVEGYWGDYMRANDRINNRLINAAGEMAIEMERTHKTKYAYASGNNPIEIQNGYFSGYELLHGTEYFSFAAIGTYDNKTKNYNFTFAVKWYDKIDKNVGQGDSIYADPLLKLGAKDYEIAIRWSQTISVNPADIKDGNFESGVPIQSSRRGIRR
jgi:hypothetical protein